MSEREERVSGKGTVIEKIMAENFPELMKYTKV